MKDRSFIIKMDAPDYEEAGEFQKGPAFLFAFEAGFAGIISAACAFAIAFFVYGTYFSGDSAAFGAWVAKTAEDRSLMAVAAAGSAALFAVMLAVFLLIKSLTGRFTMRSAEAPMAYNNFACSFIASLNGIIALLGPDEEAAGGVEANRAAFDGRRNLIYAAFFSIIFCGFSLFAAAMTFGQAGYLFNEAAALLLVLIFPWTTLIFAAVCRPVKYYIGPPSVITDILVIVTVIARLDLLAEETPVIAAVVVTFVLNELLAYLYVARRERTGCILVTNKGLRLIGLESNGDIRDASGLFTAEAIEAGPGGDFDSWTFRPPDGAAPLTVTTSGAGLEEFADLVGQATGKRPATGAAGGNPVSHNFRRRTAMTIFTAVSAAAGIVFLANSVSIIACLDGLVTRMDLANIDSAMPGDEALERKCRAMVAITPGEPCASIALVRMIGEDENSDEKLAILEEADKYQKRRIIQVDNAITRAIERNKKAIEAIRDLSIRESSGWEPKNGEALEKFRMGMAKIVNFKFREFDPTGKNKTATTCLFEAIKADPEAPGPKLMLAWQYYSAPEATIARMSEKEGVPGEVRVSLEKYEIALLTKRTGLKCDEAKTALRAFSMAAEKLAAAMVFKNDSGFANFGDRVSKVLPAAARDRIIIGYLVDRFGGKTADPGWKAVLGAAAGYRFQNRTPYAVTYGTNLKNAKNNYRSGFQKLLFEPPVDAMEFERIVPEFSGALAQGEVFTGVRWTALHGMSDREVAKAVKNNYSLMESIPPDARERIRKTK